MDSVRAYVVCFLTYWTTIGALGVNRSTPNVWIRNVTDQECTEEWLLDVTERVSRHGYSARKHTVETEDGYLLTVFRLQRPQGGVRGPPVLITHGLLQSAAMWLDAGPGVALAYLLADAGHDLWLGNVRGSHYSRRHVRLNPDTDSQYWRFCVDEIGRYDLPATIDYVLSKTGARKLNYIGFSQGGGTFFIMCSERPEYRDKVNIMIALAPATRHLRTKSVLFRALAVYYEKEEDKLNKNGVWEVFPKRGLLQSLLHFFCTLSEEVTDFCEVFKDLIDAPNPGSISGSSLRTLLAGFPAGTSVHNMARYGQSIKSKHFQKFDYGPEQNLLRYGSRTPPVYNFSSVSVPTVVIYGRNDGVVDIRDVKWLLRQLPNVLEAFEVKDPLWTHFDVSGSRNIPHLLFPKIEEYLHKQVC